MSIHITVDFARGDLTAALGVHFCETFFRILFSFCFTSWGFELLVWWSLVCAAQQTYLFQQVLVVKAFFVERAKNFYSYVPGAREAIEENGDWTGRCLNFFGRIFTLSGTKKGFLPVLYQASICKYRYVLTNLKRRGGLWKSAHHTWYCLTKDKLSASILMKMLTTFRPVQFSCGLVWTVGQKISSSVQIEVRTAPCRIVLWYEPVGFFQCP